ncbi:MAG TPA: RtcB family protein, partial [Candidatus Binatia bacterium]|nr:RtcB family protein [Candidatus Binatia bacterium]
MQLEQVGPYLWRIPRDAERGMRVPGLVVADERLIASIRSDAALEQLANGATLPGIVRAALAMPDIHQGYGLPVGGVVATDAAHGVISPGAIGFDINCGVRLVKSSVDAADIAARMERLVDALYAAIPTGVGSRGALTLDARTLDEVLARGAAWAVERGYGVPDDLERIESGGCLDGADPGKVSDRARERGRRQLG